MAAQDLTTDIASKAVQPQMAMADNLSVQSRPIADLIAADRYGKACAAARMRGRGLRFTKMIMPPQVNTGVNSPLTQFDQFGQGF